MSKKHVMHQWLIAVEGGFPTVRLCRKGISLSNTFTYVPMHLLDVTCKQCLKKLKAENEPIN